MRLDSEYHLKEFEAIDLFKRKNRSLFCKFEDFGLTIDCSAFYPGIEQYYGLGNNYLIRVQNVKNGVINYDTCETLPTLSSEYNTLKKVNPGDIVITKGGTIGEVGYVTKEAFASRDLIFIKSSHIDSKTSKYLYLYFLTRFAYKQLIRSSSQCAQPHLTITLIKNFDIYKASDEVITDSEKLYDLSVESLIEANRSYSEAEELLLRELGLMNWQPEKKSYNIKQLKESFLASGRLDAEHYQVKYDGLEALIKAAPYKTIEEIQQFNTRGVQPDYVEGGDVSVVNSKHILEDGLDYDNFEHTTLDFLKYHSRAQIGYGDILIYTTGANIGRTQVYLKDEPAIASNHVNILRVQGVNPVYLALVLNSQVGRLQTEKLCTGSAQAELYPGDIEKFIIPILSEEKQQTIADYVQKSVSLRQQAKQLLENAKLKVETALAGGGDNQIVIRFNRMIEQSTYYYRLAEWTLLEELYADKWTATASVNYSVKQYSVCQTTGRLDAEYYQPKYDALFEKLSHYRCNTISEIASIKKSIEPGSDAYCDNGVPFVRVSDITKFGISVPSVYLSRNEYNVPELRPKKDTILLSKDGSVGIAYKVSEDMDCITSGALLHLSVYNQDYLPDYVTLVLNSVIVRMQAERDSNGAIIQHWKPSEIEQVVIPHLPMETQRAIAAKVQQSFSLRSESKHLLAEAKQLVEKVIESKKIQ